MKLLPILSAFILITTVSSAQKEFEGEIHYLHLFHFRQTGIDSMQVIKDFGSSSKYFYKNGSYKWTFETSELQTEYYLAEKAKVYDKEVHNDSIFLNPFDSEDTLLRYEIKLNVDTICGYPCDMIRVLIAKKEHPDYVMKRYIYFSNQLHLNPEKFKSYTTYCNNQVFELTHAIPLRIEMDVAAWPFTMRFEAVRVIQRQVTAEEIMIPKNVPVKE